MQRGYRETNDDEHIGLSVRGKDETQTTKQRSQLQHNNNGCSRVYKCLVAEEEETEEKDRKGQRRGKKKKNKKKMK